MYEVLLTDTILCMSHKQHISIYVRAISNRLFFFMYEPLATDYTFACYDRDEAETNPAYILRCKQIFFEKGWTDKEWNWIELDSNITKNADNGISSK